MAGSDPAGSVSLTSGTNYGSSHYAVRFAYPSSIQVGKNLSVQVTLSVVDLTNLESYLLEYVIVVTISFDAYHVASGSVSQTHGVNPLYPGGHYGPVNVTIPITESNSGVGPGQTVNATVAIALEDEVEIGAPINNYVPENSQALAGYIEVQGAGGSSFDLGSYIPYILLAAGIGLAAVVFFTRGQPRPREVPSKQPP